MREVLRELLGWWREDRPVGMATVVATWRSAPRPAGASMLLGPDGEAVGSVSGGCVEDDLIDRVKSASVAQTGPELVVYGVTKAQAERFGLPCGGTLELVVERLGGESGLAELVAAGVVRAPVGSDRHQRTQRIKAKGSVSDLVAQQRR